MPVGATAPATAAGGWIPADPGPLGLAAFALTTFVLSMYNADLVGKAGEPIVFGLALTYGGIVQVLAGMWEFRRGNTFGAVAFSSYGGFWLSFWAFVQFYEPAIKDVNAAGKAVGLFLIGWGIFTLYMFVASFTRSRAIQAVFLLLTITFFLLGLGAADTNADLTKYGGYFGLATAAAAWYASFAEVMFAGHGRWILPVGPPRPRGGPTV
ncbi:MAG: acetate uptake transporter [Solirubrobacteraceae bacterium]